MQAPPTAVANQNARLHPPPAARAGAIRRRARAIPARPRQSSAPESLRIRSQVENLPCKKSLLSQLRTCGVVTAITRYNVILPLRMTELANSNRRGRKFLVLNFFLTDRFRLVGLLSRCLALLLIHPSFRDSHRQSPNARDHAYALGYRNRAACVENVEHVRALQTKIVCTEKGKPHLRAHDPVALGVIFRQCRILLQQPLTLRLAQLEMLPGLRHVRHFEVVH